MRLVGFAAVGGELLTLAAAVADRALRALVSIVVFVTLLAMAQSVRAAASNAPNLLLIVADDLGYADVGYRGSPIETPNIDSLADEGVRLERFYVHPYCAPTRASLLLGTFPPDFAFDVPGTNVDDGTSIDPRFYTLPERLLDAGYQTALIGKWHLGTADSAHPNQHGFQYFYGMIGGAINYFHKNWFGLHDWQRNGTELYETGYATTLLGRDAARYIEQRDESRPFFLMLSFNAPHFPDHALPSVVSSYRQRSLCWLLLHRCEYMAQVDTMDEEVGRVLRVLEAQGIDDETLVIFIGDNGGDEDWGAFNSPFRGEKATTFEGALRVPAVARWRSVLKAGGTSQQRIAVQDLYATIESAAGLPHRAPKESRNVWPLVRNGKARTRPPLYFTSRPPALRSECVECYKPAERYVAVLTEKWKLVASESIDETGLTIPSTRKTHLFAIDRDPYETEDIAEDHPRVAEVLERELERRGLY